MQHLVSNVVAHLSGEGIHQQDSSVGLADATLAHVEHGLLIELARRSAMRTFHVVGIDFKERLAVDFCRRSQKDVAVVLVGVGLLGIFGHIHMSVEHRRGRVVDDTLELLVAGSMRHVVVHFQVVLHMLGLVNEIKAMHLGVGTFAIQINMIGIAYITTIEGDDHDFQTAVG